MAIDPVCGMVINKANTKHKSLHEGKAYHFCREVCKERFEANPQYHLMRQWIGGEENLSGVLNFKERELIDRENGEYCIHLHTKDILIHDWDLPNDIMLIACADCGMVLEIELLNN